MLSIKKTHRENRKTIKYAVITAIVSTLLFSAVSYASSTDSTQNNINVLIEATDRKHQQFSAHFQEFLLTQPQRLSEKFKTTGALLSAVKKHINDNNSILAANIIFNNMTLLNENYDDSAIFYFINILLEKNNTRTANALFKLINDEGDQALISNTAYIFAKFSFKRNEWEKTLQLLDGVMNDLATKNRHHALLMQGISLQKLNKHRKSITYYNKIAPDSEYYLAARLNMAIANIKQGWWTSGHIIIQDTLKSAGALKQEETLNRLYLTLGYSLMNQEYYRDSGNYFRNIGINSLFAARALLGITLTSANQNDFVGALSTTHILRNKQTYELPVDESYLLMPYFYEKLQQPTTASAGYQEAINYYQKRIADIQSVIDSGINPENYPIDINIDITVEINKNPVNFSREYPDYFLENYVNLGAYQKYLQTINNKNIKMEYDQLNNKYKTTIVKMIHHILKKRVEQLDSYMDQSRFGLARLYDDNLTEH